MRLVYRTSTASLDDILWHLERCDKCFVPSLSSRVDLVDYARKMHRNAVSFEAWDEERHCLVGMINAYLNQSKGQAAYITNVSVMEECMGRGIASTLLGMCVAAAKAEGLGTILLKVSPGNAPAMRLYARAGFRAVAPRCEGFVLLARQLQEMAGEELR